MPCSSDRLASTPVLNALWGAKTTSRLCPPRRAASGGRRQEAGGGQGAPGTGTGVLWSRVRRGASWTWCPGPSPAAPR
ncbi:hypothetical protein ACFFX0_26180 [Citricoccus parietis]|uniref:Uncharacterized protein n=1 Tax=Citricoccus parietis TaxID=592307 RepID=A0ABV5G6B8_9MICC